MPPAPPPFPFSSKLPFFWAPKGGEKKTTKNHHRKNSINWGVSAFLRNESLTAPAEQRKREGKKAQGRQQRESCSGGVFKNIDKRANNVEWSHGDSTHTHDRAVTRTSVHPHTLEPTPRPTRPTRRRLLTPLKENRRRRRKVAGRRSARPKRGKNHATSRQKKEERG